MPAIHDHRERIRLVEYESLWRGPARSAHTTETVFECDVCGGYLDVAESSIGCGTADAPLTLDGRMVARVDGATYDVVAVRNPCQEHATLGSREITRANQLILRRRPSGGR